MLDALSAPLLDDPDLDAARRVTYRIEQTFRYDYDAPVAALRQRLVVVPPERHGGVRRRHVALDVRGATVRRVTRRAGAGHPVVHVRADRVEAHIEFSLAAVLERDGDDPPLLPAAALTSARLLGPTRLTRPDAALRALAAQVWRPGSSAADTAERVCAAVHAAMAYDADATSVRTTAAEAWAGGRGVCQDYAHVMLAVCRLLGVAARYGSGHLLGQGGTHAWVEVVVPHGDGAAALAWDPCNGRRAGRGHLTVATGRDYADVAPTSGSYDGPPTGRLTASRSVGVVALAA